MVYQFSGSAPAENNWGVAAYGLDVALRLQCERTLIKRKKFVLVGLLLVGFSICGVLFSLDISILHLC